MKRALPSSAVSGVGDTVGGTGVGASGYVVGLGAGAGVGAGVGVSELHAEITAMRQAKEKISISNHLGRRPIKFALSVILSLIEVYFLPRFTLQGTATG